MATIVEQLCAAQEDLRVAQGNAQTGDAKREFALAITAVEAAVMRTNRAFAKEAGTFYVADVQLLQEC